MKRRVLLLGLVLMISVMFSSIAFAGAQDFELINSTGMDITHVYVSPANVNSWQEDVLGQDILESGSSVVITFDRSEQAAYWDIKVTYASGSENYWQGFNLKEIYTVTLN